MFYATFDVLESTNYKSLELYGFSRVKEKYATVNLEMEGPLLGFGCGAMGFTGSYEYQNTCFVREYIRSISGGRLPVAGERKVSVKERAIRWTTCRLFICKGFNLSDFEVAFGEKFSNLISKTGFGKAFKLLRLLRIVKSNEKHIELTRGGLFSANMLTWAFVLHVPCRLVEEFTKTPWPH